MIGNRSDFRAWPGCLTQRAYDWTPNSQALFSPLVVRLLVIQWNAYAQAGRKKSQAPLIQLLFGQDLASQNCENE